MVTVCGKIPQVVEMNLKEAPLLGALEDARLQRSGEHPGEECENMYFHGLLKQPCKRKKTDFTLCEINGMYYVSERRNECLLSTIANHVDIVTPSVNNLDHSSKVTTITTVYCESFNLKPVILSCREDRKPAPRDEHFMLPQSFGSREIRAAMQPYEHTLGHYPPFDDGVGMYGRMPVLQHHISLHEIRQ